MTAASLSDCGMEPELREEFMMSVMRGASSGRQSFTNLVGMGSRVEVVFLIPSMSEGSTAGEMREKWESGLMVGGGEAGEAVQELGEVDRLLWMVAIFAWKNERKASHLSVVKESGVVLWGLRSLFTVEKRVMGLEEPE